MAGLVGNNPDLVEKVVPDFAMGCRRLGLGEDFLKALNTPKVTLAGSQIEAFTESGVRCEDGALHDFDVVICATGFDVSFRPPFDIIGRDGRSLSNDWEKDPEAYLALAASGYPNFLSKFLTSHLLQQNLVAERFVRSWFLRSKLPRWSRILRHGPGVRAKLCVQGHQETPNREHHGDRREKRRC